MILLDSDEVIIDARYLLENENITPGCTIDMTALRVFVGESASSSELVTSIPEPNVQAPMQVLAPSLNFKKGTEFEECIKRKFGYSVNFTNGFMKREFILVISFGRSKFKLDIHTVGIVLQSCFGGSASLFRVRFLRDRTFQFLVASLSVGFQIYNIRKFSENDFEFNINLWGQGGPNWKIEEHKYYIEQDRDWIQVSRKGKKRSRCSKVFLFLKKFLRLKTIKAWPDKSYLKWFKAHGPPV
jgi:hypothetical protein